MKIERTQNAVNNIRAGMFLRIYQMIVPFLMRTAMIYFMGVQYLGLNSLFSSILQVLNLAELGVGNAMVFAMYRPIAEDDEKTICALMKLYQRYYRIIGSVIGVVGVVVTPFIPRLVRDAVPVELNIYILYLLNLGATVLSYWLFAYKNCLLQAHQMQGVVSKITAFTYTVQCLIQLLILVIYRNYYAYIIVTLGTQVLNNVITAVVATKKYPQYKPCGKLSNKEVSSINGKIRDLFTAKLGSVVLKASDTLVISSFLGLTALAVYQNYFFILSSVIAVIELILSSMIAGLGNSYVLETREKNYSDMEKFSFLFLWLTGVCTCCFLGMYQPFMEIWVGTELMLDFNAVIMFAIYFFVYTLNRLLNVYKDAAGLWHEDRYRPLITAIVNVCLNLILVRTLGIYGVILSTVISMVCVGMPWLLMNLFSLFFERTMLVRYVRQLINQVAIIVIASLLVAVFCRHIQGGIWTKFFACAAISTIVSNLVLFTCLRKNKLFRLAVQFIDQLTKKKIALERRLFG